MSDSVLEQLQQRLQHLEDIQSIQALKARYLRACDQKQPNAMRECFVEHGAVIEADGFPAFTDREEWVETFTRLAVANPSIQDMHHGHNPQISFTGADSAKGLWIWSSARSMSRNAPSSISQVSTAMSTSASTGAGRSVPCALRGDHLSCARSMQAALKESLPWASLRQLDSLKTTDPCSVANSKKPDTANAISGFVQENWVYQSARITSTRRASALEPSA